MKKLIGKQSNLDLNKNGKLDSQDFKMLRNKKEWGGTAESSETGVSIGGENQSSMYKTGGEIKFTKTNFNSHENHNPEYDILEGYIDGDTFITYAKKVKGDNVGKESMEYYSGENYVVGSKKKSLSKNFKEDNIPAKYKPYWNKLKEMYENKTYANGGELNEMFPENDAMSYEDGGSTSNWCYSIGGL
jgi:hypothetical protein